MSRTVFGAVVVTILCAATACTSAPANHAATSGAPSPSVVEKSSSTAPRASRSPAAARNTPTGSASHEPSAAFAVDPQVAARYRGTVISRTIPTPGSKFHPRPTLIYVPAVLRTNPAARVPVIELFHGTPGSPVDWIAKGHLANTLDSYAATHHGVAPLVVLPDINGALRADTECVTTTHGDVERYLSSEVPRYVATHFHVTTDHRQWGVAGLSEGATCSVMLALRHPSTYAFFGDLSGLAHLTVGDRNNPTLTIQKLYGGSRSAYLAHDPVWLLQHNPPRSVQGFFRVGSSDHATARDQALLVAAARKAGLRTDAGQLPGAHGWIVWSTSFVQFLQWFGARI